MERYFDNKSCLMQFLVNLLDDADSKTCGICAVCRKCDILPKKASQEFIDAASNFSKRSEIEISPRKRLPTKAASCCPIYSKLLNLDPDKPTIPVDLQMQKGYILSVWGEPPWGALTEEGKHAGHFDDRLVEASKNLICEKWKPNKDIFWVACIPSLRHKNLVPDFAKRLAEELGVPFFEVLIKNSNNPPQKGMENSYHQCKNIDGSFCVQLEDFKTFDFKKPVLLVDDISDSGWTLTLASALLLKHGVSKVFPFALATSNLSNV